MPMTPQCEPNALYDFNLCRAMSSSLKMSVQMSGAGEGGTAERKTNTLLGTSLCLQSRKLFLEMVQVLLQKCITLKCTK